MEDQIILNCQESKVKTLINPFKLQVEVKYDKRQSLDLVLFWKQFFSMYVIMERVVYHWTLVAENSNFSKVGLKLMYGTKLFLNASCKFIC